MLHITLGENPSPLGEDFSVISLCILNTKCMQHYRKTSHTTYDCKYHKPVMVGLVAERVRELLRGVCKEHEVEILRDHVSKDHVHLFVSVPPHLVVS